MRLFWLFKQCDHIASCLFKNEKRRKTIWSFVQSVGVIRNLACFLYWSFQLTQIANSREDFEISDFCRVDDHLHSVLVHTRVSTLSKLSNVVDQQCLELARANLLSNDVTLMFSQRKLQQLIPVIQNRRNGD